MGNKWNLGQNPCFSHKLWNSTSFIKYNDTVVCISILYNDRVGVWGHMTVHTWGNGTDDKNSHSWFSWTVLIYVHCLFKKYSNVKKI